MTERELLARVASGLFHAPSVIKADMLQPLRASIYAFKTDFVVASWVARLKPSELDAARAELAKAGFPNPTIRSYDDQPRDTRSLTEPIDVVMDVEPRNAQTLGLSRAARSIKARSWDRCSRRRWRTASRWRPIRCRCCVPDGPMGLVLAAPVLQEGASAPAGFVTFSYELAPLMLTNDDLSLFSVVLKDPRRSERRTDRQRSGRGRRRGSRTRQAPRRRRPGR